MKIIIEIEGGVCQNVYCDEQNVEVGLLDYDNLKECPEDSEEYEYYSEIEKERDQGLREGTLKVVF